MSALILPRRFKRQPQEAAEIDWSNPLANGLLLGVLPSGATIRTNTGAFATLLGTNAATSVVTPHGLAVRTSNELDNYEAPVKLRPLSEQGAYTIHVRGLISGIGVNVIGWANTRIVLGVNLLDSNSNGFGIQSGQTAGTIAGCGRFNNSQRNTAAITVGEDTLFDAFLVVTDAIQLHVVQNGVLTSSAASSTFTQPTTDPVDSAIRIGTDTATGAPADKRTLGGNLWGRVLSSAEMIRVAKNPWKLYRRSPVEVFSSAAASGIPTLSNPLMTGITANGGVPQVTLTF